VRRICWLSEILSDFLLNSLIIYQIISVNMKLVIILTALIFSVAAHGQGSTDNVVPEQLPVSSIDLKTNPAQVKIDKSQPWQLSGNKLLTGGLMFVAGAAKGFNETLWFHWGYFHRKLPKANAQWFNPRISNLNKYKDGDPDKGAKFPLSTSALVMLTDQYHLNNFLNRASIAAAIVIKIGQKKQPFKQYVYDMLYYTATYQAGWCLTYLPFTPND
jgi:hypothetical protein